MNLKEQLIEHEGYRDEVYLCPTGHRTIGVGHKVTKEDDFIDGVKYPKQQLMDLLDVDIANAKFYANLLVKEYDLPQAAFDVVVNMTFQMGGAGVGKFKNFLACLKKKDWQGAKREGLSSRWARQTPKRANELMDIIGNL